MSQDTQRERRVFQLHMCEVRCKPLVRMCGVCFLFVPSKPSRQQSRALGLASWPVGCNQGSVVAKRLSPGAGLIQFTSHSVLSRPLPVPRQSRRESGEARPRLPTEPHQILPRPAQVSPPASTLNVLEEQDKAPLWDLRPSRSLYVWTSLATVFLHRCHFIKYSAWFRH